VRDRAGIFEPKDARKELPSKYFYDDVGSQLFEQICALDEYYLTRTELSIMQEQMAEIVTLLGPNCLLVEYGSGSSTKIRMLLDALQDPVGYVPIDNIVGRAEVIFFSVGDGEAAWKIWRWPWVVRWNRLFSIVR